MSKQKSVDSNLNALTWFMGLSKIIAYIC